MTAIGPFSSEDDVWALRAMREILDASRAATAPGVLAQGCRALHDGACEGASVDVGKYERVSLDWLAGIEPPICALVAGLTGRVRAARTARSASGGEVIGRDDLVIVRAALADAIAWKQHARQAGVSRYRALAVALGGDDE
jgi:hypothetical protein